MLYDKDELHEFDPNYTKYLFMIVRRKPGKMNPLKGFRLSRDSGIRARNKYLQHPDGHVYNQYLDLAIERLRTQEPWPGSIISDRTIKKADKMRRYGGYV